MIVNDNSPPVSPIRDSVNAGDHRTSTSSTTSVDLSLKRDSDIALNSRSSSTSPFLNNLTIQMDQDPTSGTTKGTDKGGGEGQTIGAWTTDGPYKPNQSDGDGSTKDGPYRPGIDDKNGGVSDVYKMNRRFNTPGADAQNDIHPGERNALETAMRAETGNPSSPEEIKALAQAKETAKDLPATSVGNDGARTVDLPDGKKYTSWPDGRERLEDKRSGTLIETKDGHSTSKYWDGEKYSKAEVKTGPDGSKSYHFDDGRVATPDDKNGTYTISDEKGSETYHWNKADGQYSGILLPADSSVTQPIKEPGNDNSKPPKGSIRDKFPDLFPPGSDGFPKGKNPIGPSDRDQSPSRKPDWRSGPQPIGVSPIGESGSPQPIGVAPKDGSNKPEPIGVAPSDDDWPLPDAGGTPPPELVPSGNHSRGGGGSDSGHAGHDTKPQSEVPRSTDPKEVRSSESSLLHKPNRIAPERERKTQAIMARRHHPR